MKIIKLFTNNKMDLGFYILYLAISIFSAVLVIVSVKFEEIRGIIFSIMIDLILMELVFIIQMGYKIDKLRGYVRILAGDILELNEIIIHHDDYLGHIENLHVRDEVMEGS